ncbi:4Fe-4S dicluster domain-containing protein [Thermoanaerobacterium sp. RBIITD]|uniref:4Fe-4S dicluster domain-containing protein n=1 Tax=Thermoanaerobacterium sp. RBIITD TaxID=1550240 RepID=UPI000BB91B9F|nr:4Fe-4S dicluster domain-containing protein [Thermoanaerobacterium sp. RBIITD]SNX53895.1 Formate hydrogenlyase subunit 6/NADH:ubiquinone oxidoreductase subunit (chain I) [Thermoanaerobacterium sp. RBIITD]
MFDMLKNVIGNLTKRPVTRLYPFVARKPFDIDRGHIENDIDQCILCGMCQRVCPSGCITVDRKKGTWTYEPFKCVICGVCVDKCPKKSLNLNEHYRSCTDKKYEVCLEKPKVSEKVGA